MAQFPAESYETIAKRLGSDVAALQVKIVQFHEARTKNLKRFAVMDAIVRIFNVGFPAKSVHQFTAFSSASGSRIRGAPHPSPRRHRRAVACEPTLTARGFQGLGPEI